VFLDSERRIAWLFVCAIGDGWFELVAVFVEQLHFVALPDCVSQVVDQFEDGNGPAQVSSRSGFAGRL